MSDEHTGGTVPSSWIVEVGETNTRLDIAALYGGDRFSGIVSAPRLKNVLIYTDPDEADSHGYAFDGWVEDDTVFHYTGHGPDGDQKMMRGNRAIRDHIQTGFALRVFVADGIAPGTTDTKLQRYLGEFQADPIRPYIVSEAPDRNGHLRAVFVFRLRPIGNVLVRPEDRAAIRPRVNVVSVEQVDVESHVEEADVEAQHVSEFDREGSDPMSAQRRESDLVQRYKQDLQSQGHRVTGLRVTPPGGLVPLRVDLIDHSTGELCEAKGRTTRESVRLAIGQLLDYRRFIEHEYLAILLPTKPAEDLIDLMSELRITCVYEHERGFARISP